MGANPAFRGAEGECATLISTIDWSRTTLGAIASWPPELRAFVHDMLNTRQPMLLFWGPDLVQLYNDAFVPSFGRGKHPAAMGQSARECWADAWPVIGAQIDAVMARGEPAWHEDALVPIFRNERMEEVFWTYSYSPAYDDAGTIRGTLVIVTETTGRVLSARRLALLSKLGAALAVATTHDQIVDAICAAASTASVDLPCLLVQEARGRRTCNLDAAAADRIAAAVATSPPTRDLHEVTVDDIACPVWPEPVRTALVSTIRSSAQAVAATTYVFGISPRLPYDDSYRSFIAQIVEQVAAATSRIDNANATLELQRQRDNLLLRAPVGAALLVGPTHVYELANAMYCTMVGRDPVGRSFLEAFPELAGSTVAENLDRVYRTGEPVTLAEQCVRLDRGGGNGVEDAFFNYHLEPQRDERGRVYGQLAIAVDITDQVRANRAKDEFLAMLGHELRNPLAPIVTALELMQRKEPASPERAVIERQVRHVIRLVDDLLDVSKITRGLVTLEQHVVDLADVVTAAIESSKHLIEQRQHELVVDAAPGIRVRGDEARLVQIVSNLLTNAARYTPPGGRIHVTVGTERAEAVVRVTDTGVGMSPSLLPRVFDLFVQGARNTDRSEGGLGLGLAIVKNLVAMHGGTVTAQSEGVGRGSTFTIRLARHDGTRETTPATPAAQIQRRRVLVVDDNEDAANLLGELARISGHDVAVVHHPDDALSRLTEIAPEVAILDIGLPGMDGYELASRVHAVFPSCRLIALTGFGQDKDRDRALSAGFSAHLVKPVKLGELLAMIAR